MASKPSVTLTFSGDADKLAKTMDDVAKHSQKMGVSVERASNDMATKATAAADRTGHAFSTAAGVMLASFSQAAFNQVTGFFSGMISEAREAEKISRSTAQGIATMGAASWITAKQVGDLAEAISNKTGIDDEAIQQSANLLLTFGNVRNSAGAMNDVFNRAVLASQDLAAKGFGDADSAAKMLGKALNDPIKGITALGKAGVTFTEAQKKQIKSMVEHHNLLGAQKILMAEVEKQVGGTAEATATAGDKMRVTWANFQEDLGTAVLPILDKLLTKLMAVVQWASEHPELVMWIGGVTAAIWLLNFALSANPIVLVTMAIAGLVLALVVLWTQSENFRLAMTKIWTDVRNAAVGAIDWIRDRWNGIVDWFQKLPGRIGAALSSLGGIISSAFKAGINAAIDVLNGGISKVNMLILGVNATGLGPHVSTLHPIPRLHTGGTVPGMPGTERLILARAGENVGTGVGNGGGGTWRVSGNGALAELIQRMFDSGEIEPVFR